MKLIPTDEPTFARDPSTGALVNTDNEALKMHRARRAQRQKADAMEDRIGNLENAVEGLQDTLELILKELRRR